MQTQQQTQSVEVDFLPLKGVHHVEFWVGNAKQSAYFYQKVMGFDLIAYKGPETGNREFTSYVLAQGKIRFVLTTAMDPDHLISKHVTLHGDGVRCIALAVDDAEKAFQETTTRGASPVEQPYQLSDEHGTARFSTIATYGDTVHTFVESGDYEGPFLPGFEARERKGEGVGLAAIDHIVGNVELGAMNEWVEFYAKTLGFSQLLHFDDEAISTDYTALMSKVMQDGTGKIKFPINEPAESKKKSQIEEYLDFRGPGVQHLALITGDIIGTVEQLQKNGLDFLTIPETYYDAVPERIGEIKEALEDIKRLGILVDRDDDGYLLQIFTRPVQDRPTLFFEIIQRRGCRGFGVGNFKALFEAIEREQERRGNL